MRTKARTKARGSAPHSYPSPTLFASYLDAWPGADSHSRPQSRRARKDSTRGEHVCCFLLVGLCALIVWGGRETREIIIPWLRSLVSILQQNRG